MRRAARFYADQPTELGLEGELFAVGGSLIKLSLAIFPWARRQGPKAAVKLNMILAVTNEMPAFCTIVPGDCHDVNFMDELPSGAGDSTRCLHKIIQQLPLPRLVAKSKATASARTGVQSAAPRLVSTTTPRSSVRVVRAWMEKHPRVHFYFTPTSSSWLNLVKRFFGQLTDDVVRESGFAGVTELVTASNVFLAHHNLKPTPCRWKPEGAVVLKKIQRARMAQAKAVLYNIK
jgi:hypothetical protein